MPENTSGLYAAFAAKDARFDGRIFVGISSTKIYCRPVCRAKQPLEKNCTFYRSAAEAEQAGYRPCLLCRPELAPGASRTDASASLAYRAARLLEECHTNVHGVDELALRLGCSARHLRRVFTHEYHVSPVQYLQTRRLLLAKQLLTDTALPVLDVALASGFGSLRRFNSLFKARYGLTPSAIRKQVPQASNVIHCITLSLGYRPPYRFDLMLNFLAARAISGIEVVKDKAYARTVRLVSTNRTHACGWIQVSDEPQKNALLLTVSETLLPVLPQVISRVRHLFDLYCDPGAVYSALAPMNKIRPGLCIPGTRLPGCFDAFEMAARAVLGQQITVKAAGTLAARIVSAYGMPIETGIEGLTHVFPLPDDILALEAPIENRLGPLGVTARRAQTILALARAKASGEIDFTPYASPDAEIGKLLEIPGIGSWTAQYIAMRAMEWPDAFLETDAGIKKALAPRTAAEMLTLAESWRPWRSYALINLWNAPHGNNT